MRKGFTLFEMIVSISLIAGIGTLVLVLIKNIEPTYADVYENLRQTIADSSAIYLNLKSDLKEELMDKGSITINTNNLIEEGLLEESYYVSGVKENINVADKNIVVSVEEDGLLIYDISL